MNKSQTLLSFIISVITLVSSCAGPNNPFGAIDNPEKKFIERTPASANFPQGLSIDFAPKNLVYHKNFDLTINVNDQKGITDIEQVKLYYNGREVHKLGHQELKWTLSKDHKQAQLTIPNLKLPPHLDHDLSVRYTKETEVYEKGPQAPQCQMINSKALKSLGQFKHNEHIIRMIELMAKKQGLSPSFVVALVGQQSGFDPDYVGAEQRLGLMQIKTSDSFVLSNKKDLKNWPSYPEIDRVTRLGLYTKIMFGLINSKNEWRLDPEKSLEGGIQYLKNLDLFWSKHAPEERKDLILASYYSNPYKVLKVYKSLGENWRESDEVASIIPKLREVESHCFELSSASL